MTHREARATLGSRTTRRAGTKTKVLPGASGKKPPKSRYYHKLKPRPALLVRRKVEASRALV